MADPYAVLGVPPGASKADIKAAFRKKAKAHHPDM
jgi:curved DNA-binding protein CbpA